MQFLHENSQITCVFESGQKCFERVMPLGLGKLQTIPFFHVVSSAIHGHFELNFWILVHLENTQVKYFYWLGWLIFGRVMAPRYLCYFNTSRGIGFMQLNDMIVSYQVEYSYPPLVEGNDVGSSEVPGEWKHLASLAIPDGAHNYTKGKECDCLN